ncbi:CARDB domain-containing protein, partial [Natrialba asiatica]
MDAALVDGEGPVIGLDADGTDEAIVGENATLDVTISNSGNASDEVNVGVVIGGENIENTTVSLDAGEEWSNSYDYTSD